MTRGILIAALTTGAFCAGFAAVVDVVTGALSMVQVAIVGGTSGFLGSLFAAFVWRRKS